MVTYDVYYRAVGAASWTFHGSTTSRSATVTGLTNGTQYEFQITRQAGTLPSVTSNQPRATPTAPVALDSGTITNNTQSTVTVTGDSTLATVTRSTVNGVQGILVEMKNAAWSSVSVTYTLPGAAAPTVTTVSKTTSTTKKYVFFAIPNTISVVVNLYTNTAASAQYTVTAVG